MDTDRYTANSYSRGHLGYRETAEAARRLLNGDTGYVFDTHLQCVVPEATNYWGFNLTSWEQLFYRMSVDAYEDHTLTFLRTCDTHDATRWCAESYIHADTEC